MPGSHSRGVLLFVESNSSGTGRLFVEAARALGCHPVLLTARPEKYAYLSREGAPEVVVVPRVEEEELGALIDARFGGRIAGITSSSEYFVALAAALAARFGRPGPNPARMRAARDKSVQRSVLAAAGVPLPAFRSAASAAAAVASAEEIGFPVVLKPVAGSGSVGVRVCLDAFEAEEHAAALLAAEPPPEGGTARVLVEEVVAGEEFSVEMFSGRVVGITRKHVGSPPFFVESGHDHPAALPMPDERVLVETARYGTALLGLGWGPLHWELRLCGGRAIPMEVNPRLAGGFIPELVRHARGIDLIRETLRLVVGDPPELAPSCSRHASIRFLFPPASGRLGAVEGVAEALTVPGVVDLSLYREPGEEVVLRGDFRDRIGHVMACAETGEAAAAAAERGRSAVELAVAPEHALAAEGVA